MILADVLHHAQHPHRLINECARVTRRLLVIKDHKWTAYWPSFGLHCSIGLPTYRTALHFCTAITPAQQWREWHTRHRFAVEMKCSPCVYSANHKTFYSEGAFSIGLYYEVDDPGTGRLT